MARRGEVTERVWHKLLTVEDLPTRDARSLPRSKRGTCPPCITRKLRRALPHILQWYLGAPQGIFTLQKPSATIAFVPSVISLLTGSLVSKDLDRVEVLTSGGVGYELFVPLSTFEALPRQGEKVTLHTELVVREDAWSLYGFSTLYDRQVFRRLLVAKGVGPSLALGLLSTLSAERVTRALREKDIATLQQVPRVGRKKAEQMILDLADKLGDLTQGAAEGSRPEGATASDAIRAMVSLGYALADAERAVRKALESIPSPSGAPELIRAALPHISRK